MPNGKLLVLDGLDGSGKSTQFELLQTALQKQGVSIQAVSFPDYDSPSAALVKMYLNGELSNTPDGVNAYAASSFYAVDRYANYHLHWEQAYHNGTCILASRYTTSNAIYQMGKLPKSEWDNYLQWLACTWMHRSWTWKPNNSHSENAEEVPVLQDNLLIRC